MRLISSFRHIGLSVRLNAAGMKSSSAQDRRSTMVSYGTRRQCSTAGQWYYAVSLEVVAKRTTLCKPAPFISSTVFLSAVLLLSKSSSSPNRFVALSARSGHTWHHTTKAKHTGPDLEHSMKPPEQTEEGKCVSWQVADQILGTEKASKNRSTTLVASGPAFELLDH